jgi:hypothetical protein
VPRPGLGYWQRLRHGKSVRKPPLPDLREGESGEDVIERPKKEELDPGTSSEFVTLAAREKDPTRRIVVPETLVDPCALVVRAEKTLRHSGTDQFGLLSPRAEGRLSIRVSRASLDRALRIMDTLVKAFEAREFSVSVTPGEEGYTSVRVFGEEVPFWMEETVDAVERPLTEEEKKDKAKFSWMYRSPQYNHVLSGRLALRIGSARYSGIRRKVADSARRRLEDCLNKFVEVAVLGAERQQSERLKRERREREWEEQARLRREEEERRRKEQEKVERLTQQVKDWVQSRRIREYVADIQAITANPGKWNFSGIPLPKWTSWALEYADKIDPVAPIRKDRQAEVQKGPESTANPEEPSDRP